MMSLLLAAALLVLQGVPSQTGSVSGQIRNPRGAPAAGVRVAAMVAPREGEAGVPTLAAFAMTDNAGRYTIEQIDPGTYYITAGSVVQPTYFPGVLSESKARALTVTAGAKLSGIDFETIMPSTYTVSGRVVLPPGQQAPPNPLIALAGPTTLSTTPRPDGTFEFLRVRAGSYNLRSSFAVLLPPIPVEVVEADVTGVEIVIPAVFPVMVTVSGAAPRTSLLFTDVVKKNNLSEVAGAQRFTINLPEGEYRVVPGRTANGYEVKSLTAGTADLFKNTFKVAGNASPLEINVGMEALPLVRFAGQATQPLRRIVLHQAGYQDVEGTTQPEGSFAFDSIAPGTYTAAITTVQGTNSVQNNLVVPPGGKLDHEIRIAEVRQLFVRIITEGNFAFPIVRMNFEGPSASTSITADASLRDTPLGLSLPEGEYKVSVTIRSGGGRVKALTFGAADLLTTSLNVAGNTPPEIRLTLAN
jgi:hypothetical protein